MKMSDKSSIYSADEEEIGDIDDGANMGSEVGIHFLNWTGSVYGYGNVRT